MTKARFLKSLKRAMRGYPAETVKKTVDYYDEMISDRMEEGLSEEAAVAAMDSAEQIAASFPTEEGARRRVRRSLTGREIALIIIGFPIWLPLLISAFAVALSLFAVAFALIVALAALLAGLGIAAAGLVVTGIWQLISGNLAVALTFLGGGLIAGGLCLVLIKPCMALENLLVGACKKVVRKGAEKL